MSTRSYMVIRPHDLTTTATLEARYVHFDGRPTSRLVALAEIAKNMGVPALVETLVSRTEWSSIDPDTDGTGDLAVAGFGKHYGEDCEPVDEVTYTPHTTSPALRPLTFHIEWIYVLDPAAGTVEVFENHVSDGQAPDFRGRINLTKVTAKAAKAIEKGTYTPTVKDTHPTQTLKARITWDEYEGTYLYRGRRKTRSRSKTVKVPVLDPREAPIVATTPDGTVRALATSGQPLIPVVGYERTETGWSFERHVSASNAREVEAKLAQATTGLYSIEDTLYQPTAATPTISVRVGNETPDISLNDGPIPLHAYPDLAKALTEECAKAGLPAPDLPEVTIHDADTLAAWDQTEGTDIRAHAQQAAAAQALNVAASKIEYKGWNLYGLLEAHPDRTRERVPEITEDVRQAAHYLAYALQVLQTIQPHQ